MRQTSGAPFAIHNKNRHFTSLLAVVAAVLFVAVQMASHCAAPKVAKQRTFETPEAVVQAFVDAARKGDHQELLNILGPRGEEVLSSGDHVADKLARDKFLESYDQKHHVVKNRSGAAQLVLGEANWPFPIPIAKDGKRWRFDTDRGAEEVLNRRIGRNELSTIEVLDAFVSAQREYCRFDYDRDAVLEYAQRVVSSEGSRDGLFWPSSKKEKPSPMGGLFAQASAEGYQADSAKRTPYHGYFFKVLLSQGPDAPGGAFPYVVNGNMVSGFAMVAWPAEYGNSGIMTFLVNANGTVYEKDLGEKSGDLASGMTAYNPDQTWKRAK